MGFVFGTAGMPISCKGTGTIEGVAEVRKLGLDAMELEFVQGVHMREETAKEVKQVAEKNKVSLSVHAPYFINLLSEEREKVRASGKRIMDSCRIGGIAGAKRIVFHPAYYGKMEKKDAYEEMRKRTGELVDALEEEKIENAILAPETTGKLAQFGSVDELFSLAKEYGLQRVNPCVDFGHLHARTNGGLKERKDFLEVLERIEKIAGRKALETMHVHFAGNLFSERGERKHLEISSKSPDFSLLAEALIEKECSGTIISESPNIEKDAIKMQKIYSEIKNRRTEELKR